MQVGMGHVFLEFSVLKGSNYQFYWDASYIETDRQKLPSYCHHSCTPESESLYSLENMFYKIFYPLKVPFYPLPY